MPRIIVIATHNKKKFAEMATILAPLAAAFRSLDDFGPIPPVPETADTFEENACAKALGYAGATGQWAIADDSGLEVDALGGRPGVQSARFGGEQGNDRANNEALMRALEGLPRETWTARYRCVTVLATPEKVLLTTEGTVEGCITDRPAGDRGFGYDPYFLVPDLGLTMAELAPEVKNRLSHRGKALEALKERLEKLL